MNQQSENQQPLALPRSPIPDSEGNPVDILGRQNLIELLSGYLDRLRVGTVLAIDARWGEGKTWFGQRWASHLCAQEHKVIFIDAFAQDYMDDPFMLISAEISDAFGDTGGPAKKLRKSATGVMKAILPFGAKALINLSGRIALGSTDLSEDIAETIKGFNDETADATSLWIEKKLQDHKGEKKSFEQFRTDLTEFVASRAYPEFCV